MYCQCGWRIWIFRQPKPLLDEMRALLDHGVLGYELDAQAAIETSSPA
jgi:hypothetical protein